MAYKEKKKFEEALKALNKEVAKYKAEVDNPSTGEWEKVGIKRVMQKKLQEIQNVKKSQHREAYKMAIKKRHTVKIRPVRFNYVGLPRSGKTFFRRRLMGELSNINEAIRKGLKGNQPSTGIAEDGGQVFIKRSIYSDVGTIQKGSEWSVLKDLAEEANMLNHFVYEVVNDEELKGEVDGNHQKSAGFFAKRKEKKLAKAEDKIIEKTFSIIQDAMEAEDWEKIKHLLDNIILLINTDTGGQAEFLEMQASLVHGPSFNLLFRRLVDPLDRPFPMYYTNEEGVDTEKEDCIMTAGEVIFQALSSIACFSGCFSDCDDISVEDGGSEVCKDFKKHVKSKVMFVGTHRDKVSDGDFKKEDDILKQKIVNTEFYEKGIIEFASRDQVMLAVDNMGGNEEEIRNIRQTLVRVIEKNFEQIDIPVAWLMLSLHIRNRKVRTMGLQDCERLAASLKIDPEELQDALWFLHHCIGVLLYYPEIDTLRDTVICDMQVVYDSASNLIRNTFTFENVGVAASEKFEEKAQFTLEDVKRAMKKHTDDLLPSEKLIALLEYRNVLTVIPPRKGDHRIPKQIYFMPSVLRCARPSDLSITSNLQVDPAPLMLRYDSGYIPIGVFPAMITNLVSQIRDCDPQLDNWEMIEDGLRKNKVQFLVGADIDTVTLISHSQYFEIAITRSKKIQVPTETLCHDVRSVIQSTLETVTSQMNYHFSMGYKFGFKCPIVHPTPSRDHLCVFTTKKAGRKMKCLLNPKKKEPVVLEERHRVWFAKEFDLSDLPPLRSPKMLSPSSASESASSCGKSFKYPRTSVLSKDEPISSDGNIPHASSFSASSRPPEETKVPTRAASFHTHFVASKEVIQPKDLSLIKWKEHDGQIHRFKLMDKVSAKWKSFAERLNRETNYVETLEQEYQGERCTGRRWKRVMEDWLNGEEPCDEYPTTWTGLCTLLEDVEYAEVAAELRKVLKLAAIFPSKEEDTEDTAPPSC